MKVKQFFYPFKNKLIELPNITCVQIGIESPYATPLEFLNENAKILLYVSNEKTGNFKEYLLTEREILEFSYLYNTNMRIRIADSNINNPYLIINLAYETED